jgi:hypothetical protein
MLDTIAWARQLDVIRGEVPSDVDRDLRVRVVVGDTVLEATVSGLELARVAADVDLPMGGFLGGFLGEEDYEKRMMRRELMRVLSRVVPDVAHTTAWLAVSKMLGLDPERGA